jgi:hypothetical protein
MSISGGTGHQGSDEGSDGALESLEIYSKAFTPLLPSPDYLS